MKGWIGGMPRPPKHVPPDTLGGRIRAARESLNLSLASVAADRYSTSLISQIERNRVEPSRKSLEFLAEKLQLPLEDLEALARQQKESESEGSQYGVYEELLSEATHILEGKRPQEALDVLNTLNMSHIPFSLRWRLAAARGHCYFTLRQFLNAQKDFLYAVTEKPEFVPAEYLLEAMALHLHLAATVRELNQPDAAFEHYTVALSMMDAHTSLHFVAEVHRGMSLIALERFNKALKKPECVQYREAQLELALEHTENACILYRSIGDFQRAALLTCQIGLIEQASGNFDEARKHLLQVLLTCIPECETPVQVTAACLLAGIELEVQNYDEALKFVQQARSVAQLSDTLRLAEAEAMYGRILEAKNINDPAAEVAFRKAIHILTSTDHIAAQIQAHDVLGRHLLKKGYARAGEEELDIARHLTGFASAFSSTLLFSESGFDELSKNS
jgi:tetratricopeptide (TPR) repeat protein